MRKLVKYTWKYNSNSPNKRTTTLKNNSFQWFYKHIAPLNLKVFPTVAYYSIMSFSRELDFCKNEYFLWFCRHLMNWLLKCPERLFEGL